MAINDGTQPFDLDNRTIIDLIRQFFGNVASNLNTKLELLEYYIAIIGREARKIKRFQFPRDWKQKIKLYHEYAERHRALQLQLEECRKQERILKDKPVAERHFVNLDTRPQVQTSPTPLPQPGIPVQVAPDYWRKFISGLETAGRGIVRAGNKAAEIDRKIDAAIYKNLGYVALGVGATAAAVVFVCALPVEIPVVVGGAGLGAGVAAAGLMISFFMPSSANAAPVTKTLADGGRLEFLPDKTIKLNGNILKPLECGSVFTDANASSPATYATIYWDPVAQQKVVVRAKIPGLNQSGTLYTKDQNGVKALKVIDLPGQNTLYKAA